MRPFRSRWSAPLAGLMVLVLLASCSTSTATIVHALPLATYHANNSRTGYSPSSSITPSNADGLRQRWSVAVAASISDQAVVDNGVVYWGDWTGHMHATSISGKSLWSTALGTGLEAKGVSLQAGDTGNRKTPTVGSINGENLVWVGGGAGQLVALNTSTGAVVWSTSLGTPPEHEVWSSPALYKGSIYVGVASFNDCPVIDGSIDRVNAATGAIQAINHLSPSAKCLGPGVWSSPSVDPSSNSIFVSTSNANLRSNPSDLPIARAGGNPPVGRDHAGCQIGVEPS